MIDPATEEVRIPIHAETASIGKREIETGRVRVQTFTDEEHVVVRDAVTRERIEIRHVPIGRQVGEAPAMRVEAGVTIIPVVEERLVVEKRLFLVEEVHVLRHSDCEAVELPATLRRTRVEIERDDLITPQEDI